MLIELKLSEQELAVLYQGLGELPLKLAGPVFSKIQAQQQAQLSEGVKNVQATK